MWTAPGAFARAAVHRGALPSFDIGSDDVGAGRPLLTSIPHLPTAWLLIHVIVFGETSRAELR